MLAIALFSHNEVCLYLALRFVTLKELAGLRSLPPCFRALYLFSPPFLFRGLQLKEHGSTTGRTPLPTYRPPSSPPENKDQKKTNTHGALGDGKGLHLVRNTGRKSWSRQLLEY